MAATKTRRQADEQQGLTLRESAPMPGDDNSEPDDDRSMEQVLLEAGAKRGPRGTWYRLVPDPRSPKRIVVEGGKVYLETDWVRRKVATAEDPIDAILKARADENGMTDAYMPGVGWVRNGWKPEREHPTNIGTKIGGPAATQREEIAIDTAEAQKALALKNVLQAAADERRQELEPTGEVGD